MEFDNLSNQEKEYYLNKANYLINNGYILMDLFELAQQIFLKETNYENCINKKTGKDTCI